MSVRRKQTPDLRKSWVTEIFPDSRQKSGLKSTIVLRCAAEVVFDSHGAAWWDSEER